MDKVNAFLLSRTGGATVLLLFVIAFAWLIAKGINWFEASMRPEPKDEAAQNYNALNYLLPKKQPTDKDAA